MNDHIPTDQALLWAAMTLAALVSAPSHSVIEQDTVHRPGETHTIGEVLDACDRALGSTDYREATS